jgi:hypothetical protein
MHEIFIFMIMIIEYNFHESIVDNNMQDNGNEVLELITNNNNNYYILIIIITIQNNSKFAFVQSNKV